MFSINVKNKILKELDLGRAGRDEGNEGLARVAARRACGIAIREYLKQRSNVVPEASTIDLFTFVENFPDFPEQGKKIAGWMRQRVDENHELPAGIDLLTEAQRLVDLLDL